MRFSFILICVCFKLVLCVDYYKSSNIGPIRTDYHKLYETRMRECEYCSMVCPSTFNDMDSDKRTSKHFQEFMKMLENSKNMNDNFIQGMNLSGRLEPSLYVEEPNYIILRNNEHALQNIEYDPFIPPRGRKHENGKPNLSGLIKNYNDLFVPNRGKKEHKERRKDNIKDIFKYDDLFIPNRGKKCSDKLACGEPPKNVEPLDSPLADYFRILYSNQKIRD